MKSKFVKTLLVSSLVATIATGCGDDKDNNKSADTQAKNEIADCIIEAAKRKLHF